MRREHDGAEDEARRVVDADRLERELTDAAPMPRQRNSYSAIGRLATEEQVRKRGSRPRSSRLIPSWWLYGGCTPPARCATSGNECTEMPTKCGGGGIRTHGSLAAPTVFKMAFGLREPSCFRMFSNVRRDRRPDSSRLVPARFDPLAVHVAVQTRLQRSPDSR